MSEVEQTWNQLAVKFGDNRTWHQLSPQQQHIFIQGINQVLAVIHRIV